jgi:large subunit ribosomal protein L1
MPTVGKRLGIVLAPRGKMPRPIAPGADPKSMVDNLRKSVAIRSKDKMTFHVPVGTTDLTPEQIADNIDLIIKRIAVKLEKGTMNIRSAYIKTTMGPAERLI